MPESESGNSKKTLAKNYVFLMLLQGANYVLPLITLPYLVRVLGTEKYGLIAFALAFINYFVILTDYGFTLSATREISVHRDNINKVRRIFSAVLAVKGMLVFASFGLMAIVIWIFPKFHEFWPIYVLTFGMVVGQAILPLWFFQGMERMGFVTALNLTAKLIFTFAIFIFVRTGDDVYWVPVTHSAGFIVAGMAGMWLAWRRFDVRFVWPHISDVKASIKDSSMYFLSRLSVSFYTSSNAFVLGLFTDTTMVGYYAMAEKLYLGIQGLFTTLSSVVYPYMSKRRDIALFKNILSAVIIASLVLGIAAMMGSNLIFWILFSSSNATGISAFKLFGIVVAIVGPSILIGYPLLAGWGLPRAANVSVILGATAHLCGLVILASWFTINIQNVVILVIVSESIVLIVRVTAARKILLGGRV